MAWLLAAIDKQKGDVAGLSARQSTKMLDEAFERR